MCLLFFNDTATTEIYTLSLHDALPIFWTRNWAQARLSQWPSLTSGAPVLSFGRSASPARLCALGAHRAPEPDRKSTRLNSSHANISYAVFCLKKKHTLYR